MSKSSSDSATAAQHSLVQIQLNHHPQKSPGVRGSQSRTGTLQIVLHDKTAALETVAQEVALVLLLLLLLLLLRVVLLRAVILMVSSMRALAIAVASLIAMRLGWERRRGFDATALQVDIKTALVLLGGIVQTEFPAKLLNSRLQLLHPSSRVVALADDDMQMGLTSGLGMADARLKDVLGLLNELAVEVDGVIGYATRRIVLAEDELGCLLVIFGLLFLVSFA
jgi:hypothetical protein